MAPLSLYAIVSPSHFAKSLRGGHVAMLHCLKRAVLYRGQHRDRFQILRSRVRVLRYHSCLAMNSRSAVTRRSGGLRQSESSLNSEIMPNLVQLLPSCKPKAYPLSHHTRMTSHLALLYTS